jgi:hypothetical protein
MAQIASMLHKFHKRLSPLAECLYNAIEGNIRFILYFSLVISIIYGVLKTVVFLGYNVDSYQLYALSIERWLRNGTQDYLFNEYTARHRFLYPLIIAVLHIIIPTDIAILACILNLIFALSSVIVLRRILQLRSYSKFEVDLCSLFLVMSYNFLNYWFNILTDMAGLCFFLIMIYFIQSYIINGSHLNLLFSCLALLGSIFCREIYILGAFVYIFISKSWIKRIVVIAILTIIGIASFFLSESVQLLVELFIPMDYRPIYQQGDYLQVFILLHQRWLDPYYTIGFLKGLVKVGIIPTTISIVVIYASKGFPGINELIRKIKEMNPILFWLIFFVLAYLILNGNITSPSGLRYWLPVSWIPLIFMSKAVVRETNDKVIKLGIIAFLVCFPFSWSSLEWYVNRHASTGTGSLLTPNQYSNDMDTLLSISFYDSNNISLSIEDNSYLNATSLSTAYINQENISQSVLYIKLWKNITQEAIIRIRLRSPNNGYFKMALYEVNRDLSPGWGKEIYTTSFTNVTSIFETLEFTINTVFLLRAIALYVGGGHGKQIHFDYLSVEIQ